MRLPLSSRVVRVLFSYPSQSLLQILTSTEKYPEDPCKCLSTLIANAVVVQVETCQNLVLLSNQHAIALITSNTSYPERPCNRLSTLSVNAVVAQFKGRQSLVLLSKSKPS